MLTDYQCIDCQKVEREIEEILASRSDVSLSVKHYPMCAEAAPGVPCNPYVKQTLHANACWAARAAEAAGILKGDQGILGDAPVALLREEAPSPTQSCKPVSASWATTRSRS